MFIYSRVLGETFTIVKKENLISSDVDRTGESIKRKPKHAFRGEAINVDTEEEIFYIPKSALYSSNMWEAAPGDPSGPRSPFGQSAPGTSYGPSAPGNPYSPSAVFSHVPASERLVTWRPDMARKENKTEGPVRHRYQPTTRARQRIVTWVPKITTTEANSYPGQTQGTRNNLNGVFKWYKEKFLKLLNLIV